MFASMLFVCNDLFIALCVGGSISAGSLPSAGFICGIVISFVCFL